MCHICSVELFKCVISLGTCFYRDSNRRIHPWKRRYSGRLDFKSLFIRQGTMATKHDSQIKVVRPPRNDKTNSSHGQ